MFGGMTGFVQSNSRTVTLFSLFKSTFSCKLGTISGKSVNTVGYPNNELTIPTRPVRILILTRFYTSISYDHELIIVDSKSMLIPKFSTLNCHWLGKARVISNGLFWSSSIGQDLVTQFSDNFWLCSSTTILTYTQASKFLDGINMLFIRDP